MARSTGLPMTAAKRHPPGFVPTLVVVALVLLVTALPVGRAQSGSVPSTLAGTWIYDGTIARAVRIIDAAFAPGLASYPEMFQGYARRRLRTSMAPPGRVTVALASTRVQVSLQSTARTTVVDGSLGTPASVTGAEGDPRVTPRLESGWLELFYEGEGSELRQLLSTEPDGARMHLDFTVVSPQLPSTVRYRLDYVRPRP